MQFAGQRRNSLDADSYRRRTASLSTPHRSSDIQVGPVEAADMFRAARGVSSKSRDKCVSKSAFEINEMTVNVEAHKWSTYRHHPALSKQEQGRRIIKLFYFSPSFAVSKR